MDFVWIHSAPNPEPSKKIINLPLCIAPTIHRSLPYLVNGTLPELSLPILQSR